MEKEVFAKLQSILTEKLGIDRDKIKMDAKLVEDLGIDSFAGIELAFMLEDEFEIKIPDEEMSELKTVDDAIKAIKQKMQ